MIRVRLTTSFPEWPLMRQTPGSQGAWGDYLFSTGKNGASCDAWVVYEGLARAQTAVVPPERVLFVAAEPPSIRGYSGSFLDQFAKVITCQHSIHHPGRILRQQAQPWHAGVARGPRGEASARLDYDAFRSSRNIAKTGLISVVCSSKTITPGHRRRLDFIERASRRLGDSLALFGTGFTSIEDKWEAIHPFRFHLVIENERLDHFWTEKLADAFLGLSFPIYHGCPNVDVYFPRGSFEPIDIDRADEALAQLESVVSGDLDRRSASLLDEAKRRVLDEHNLFPMLATAIASLPAGKPQRLRILPETAFTREGWRSRASRLSAALTRQLPGRRGGTIS